MDEKHFDQIRRVKELLETVPFAAMATVNEDGSPHNTPYFFMHDENLVHLYWGSHPESLHSKNVERTGQIFVVLYNSVEYGKGGIYIAANNAHRLVGAALDEGLRVHNVMRAHLGKTPLPRSYYDNGPQAMYGADVVRLEMHTPERGSDGHITREIRRIISAKDLLDS